MNSDKRGTNARYGSVAFYEHALSWAIVDKETAFRKWQASRYADGAAHKVYLAHYRRATRIAALLRATT